MIARGKIVAPSSDLRADVIERGDGLFEVMVFRRMTDTFEGAVALAREEVER
jgi:hypothetical protein